MESGVYVKLIPNYWSNKENELNFKYNEEKIESMLSELNVQEILSSNNKSNAN